VTRTAVLAALLGATAVAAQPRPLESPIWRWWTNPTVVAEIGLTPRQGDAIERAQAASRAERAETGRLLRDRRVRLGELMSAPTVDRAEVARVLGEIARSQRAQLRSIVHLRLRVRRILRPEQVARLLELHPRIMERPWEPQRRIGRMGLRPPGG
jgi:Spy/CpxP family protein refolding chaperone